MSDTPSQREVLEKLIDSSCIAISEHALSVRIFATYQTEDGKSNTAGITSGRGSLYAQIGHVDEWLIEQREFVKEHARKICREDEE